MRLRLPVLCLLALSFAGCGSSDDDAEPTPAADRTSARVDPFIGSGGFGYAFGSSFAGALAPNGLVKLGPDTEGPWATVNFLHYSGYWYGDDRVRAFSHLHLHGTGATDYGAIGVMPTTAFDPARTHAADYVAHFDKKTEKASPGSYEVTLDGGIEVQLTATPHVGLHRYRFPAGVPGTVVVDLGHHLEGGKIDLGELSVSPGEARVTGKLHSASGMSGGFGGYDLYFDLRAKQPWTSHAVWASGAAPTVGGTSASGGEGAGVALTFAPDQPVELAVGVSFVSLEGATKNLAAESPSVDVDAAKTRTQAAWSALTDRVRVTGGTASQRTIFKTALYHAFVMPTEASDVDGAYRGPDKQTHVASGFRYFTDMSLWDTYRTLHPLYALVAPVEAKDSVRSLHAFATHAGFFPKWPVSVGDSGTMIGASAEVVIADAYVKGIRDFDAQDAYQRLRAAAMDPAAPPGGRGGRGDVEPYMTLGYVPSSRSGSVSKTTEYGNDDFALSELARALGHTADADALAARAKGYRKLFDPATGTLRAKKEDGTFAKATSDQTKWSDEYTEANGYQSVWMAAHDVDGLATLFGGREAMVTALDAFFANAKADLDAIEPDDTLRRGSIQTYYWAANEPDIHAPYLFAQVGRPDLCQKWVRWAMGAAYGDGPDGLPGNDDGGTMSAWYVFSALGFYPLPGSDRYIVGTPLFERAEIDVPGGTFVVEAPGASDKNLYVQSVTLDGAPLAKPELRHADLKPGSRLVFVLGEAPGSWGR